MKLWGDIGTSVPPPTILEGTIPPVPQVSAPGRRERGGYRGDRWATSRRHSARRSGRTGARIRLKIVMPFGTGRLHKPTKSEVNRQRRFNLASIKRSSTWPRLIEPIRSPVYRTPFRNGTLNLHEIWQECRFSYATHFHQISSKSNKPFVQERTKCG